MPELEALPLLPVIERLGEAELELPLLLLLLLLDDELLAPELPPLPDEGTLPPLPEDAPLPLLDTPEPPEDPDGEASVLCDDELGMPLDDAWLPLLPDGGWRLAAALLVAAAFITSLRRREQRTARPPTCE